MTGTLRVVAASILTAGLLMLPAPAQAANWQTVIWSHGGKVQMCKKWVRAGTYQIRVRLNNRQASHRHRGGASIRRSDGSVIVSRTFGAAAGRISEVKYLKWRRGTRISFGIGHPGDSGGVGASEAGVSWLRRC